MCFSATASFTTSAILVPAGIYCSHYSLKNKKNYFYLSLLPILFGIQQFFEGFVWLSISSGNESGIKIFSFFFLFFAFALWPFYCPFIIYSLENNGTIKKTILFYLTILGAVLGILIYFPLIIQTNLFTTNIVKNCICYKTDRSETLKNMYTIIYFFVTVIPFFMAHGKKIKIFGLLLLISIGFTLYFYKFAFFSVWCFFAAALSLFILYIIKSK